MTMKRRMADGAILDQVQLTLAQLHPTRYYLLPGDKIKQRGFGWAPRTWMSATPIDAPDPLGIINSTGELDTANLTGLRVSYPGFLLESKNKKLLLATDKQQKRFWFPTGPNLVDWYVVEPADDSASPRDLQRLIGDSQPWAIILSRSRPGHAHPDIALLVRIREIVDPNQVQSTHLSENETRHTGSDISNEGNEREFHCEIIRRVKISRETHPKFIAVNRGRFFQDYTVLGDDDRVPEGMVNTDLDNVICVAEELDNGQVWYVDGYFPDREETTLSSASHDEPPRGPFPGG
ncbi:hypothetical protein F4808DRAFT_35234 [Astrocystis sublimbata]|nr:hypothetical protein F4808DRAFT_35234 [Astrocystis sublimbata]